MTSIWGPIVLALTLLIPVIAVVVGVRLALRNHAEGDGWREALAERLLSLRIHRMLEHLGIDRRRYLCRVRGDKIRFHLGRCAVCADLEACDACLESGEPADDYGFCPNHDDLIEVLQRLTVEE